MGLQIEQLKNNEKENKKEYHAKRKKVAVYIKEKFKNPASGPPASWKRFCFCDRWDSSHAYGYMNFTVLGGPLALNGDRNGSICSTGRSI